MKRVVVLAVILVLTAAQLTRGEVNESNPSRANYIQVNGVAVSTGNGASDTGTQRVAIASLTSAAYPICDKSAVITATAAATTQIVAISGTTLIYVCGFSISGAGAAGTLTWKYGTGAACATGGVSLSGAYVTAIGQAISYGNGVGIVFRTIAGQALCITMATAAATASGVVTYAQL